jgi:hypothetical protein
MVNYVSLIILDKCVQLTNGMDAFDFLIGQVKYIYNNIYIYIKFTCAHICVYVHVHTPELNQYSHQLFYYFIANMVKCGHETPLSLINMSQCC